MDVDKILAAIKEKTGLSDDICQKAADVIAQNFGQGQNNKDKIIGLLKDKVKLDDKKANDVYNAVAEFLSGNVVDKIKGFFKK